MTSILSVSSQSASSANASRLEGSNTGTCDDGLAAFVSVRPRLFAIAYRMLDLERYFREGRANDITHDIHDVTGREPISFAQHVWDTVATGVWDATAPVAHT